MRRLRVLQAQILRHPLLPLRRSSRLLPLRLAAAALAGPAEQMADEPVKAITVLQSIVAQKLKKTLDQIPLSKTIKDLVGGKSTLQNEILGDLGKEFGSHSRKIRRNPAR